MAKALTADQQNSLLDLSYELNRKDSKALTVLRDLFSNELEYEDLGFKDYNAGSGKRYQAIHYVVGTYSTIYDKLEIVLDYLLSLRETADKMSKVTDEICEIDVKGVA